MVAARRAAAGGVLLCLSLCACQSGTAPESSAPAELGPLAALGKKLFDEKRISASGEVACASCHDPGHAHADPRAVSLGGVDGAQPGVRNAPSLRYLERAPSFFFDEEGTPTGGFFRDGRTNSLAEQARRPLLRDNEMANGTAQAFAERLRQTELAGEFQALFGAEIFEDPEATLDRAVFAIQAYELEDPDFHPYSSKYDEFLRGRATLSDQELRGLALFNNPQKGNCAACHPGNRGADGSAPLFTDFTYDNLGVPRNPDIAANADPSFYDLGLCGPDRTDLVGTRPDLCGAFKVPTLRNIALTAPYFHNGRFATLKQALQFYVRRDTNPEEFYPLAADGTVDKFDDLPPQYRANVNTSEVPYDRKLGQQPRLSEAEIDDLAAFLGTLSDGYVE